MAAVLFDARVAALMALVIAVLAATGTRDPGVVTYGLLSAMVPVGFVSSLSSRGSYRKAVLASSVAAAAIAGAVAWFFHTNADQESWYAAALSVGQSAAPGSGGVALDCPAGSGRAPVPRDRLRHHHQPAPPRVDGSKS